MTFFNFLLKKLCCLFHHLSIEHRAYKIINSVLRNLRSVIAYTCVLFFKTNSIEINAEAAKLSALQAEQVGKDLFWENED